MKAQDFKAGEALLSGLALQFAHMIFEVDVEFGS